MSTKTLDNHPAEPDTLTGRRSCLQKTKRAHRNPATRPGTSVEASHNDEVNMQHETRPPDKLPDPWLFDSEALIRELDRCRETVLQIPITNANATHFGIQLAVNAIWNLRETLRELLHLHHEAQRQIRKQHMLELQEQFSQQAPDPSDPQKIIPIAKTARKTGRSSPGGWKPNESLPRASVTNRTTTRNRRG
jgi:hypothetical protein